VEDLQRRVLSFLLFKTGCNIRICDIILILIMCSFLFRKFAKGYSILDLFQIISDIYKKIIKLENKKGLGDCYR
jgi:hypothetical protein